MNPRRWINENAGPATLVTVVVLAASLLYIHKEISPRRSTATMPTTPVGPIVQRINPYGMRSPPGQPLEDPALTAQMTLDQPLPAPGRAVVLDRPVKWWCSHWAGRTPGCVAVEQGDESVRFIVGQPDHRRVWVKYLNIPIDAGRYPVLVMKYRAQNTHPEATEYALYLDDGCGPDYGGLLPFAHRDIVADGQTHVLVCDLRSMKPLEQIIGLAVGVHSSSIAPAVFELLDLRFETLEEPTAETETAPALTVRVTDVGGRPVAGATVAVDAERRNWARTADTAEDGTASLIPFRTASGEHMVRVAMAGMVPVEAHVPTDHVGPLEVSLRPASVYSGVVCDESGEPLSGASVWLHVDCDGARMLPVQAMTDDAGRWSSPPFPTRTNRIEVGLVHPLFDDERGFSALYARFPGPGETDLGTLCIRQASMVLHGAVSDRDGAPICGAKVRACWSKNEGLTDADGAFSIDITQDGEPLIFEHEDYAAKAVLHAAQAGDGLAVTLDAARTVVGRIVDADERPVKGLRVHACLPGLMRVNFWECETGGDGAFRWKQAPDHPITFCVCGLGVREMMVPRPAPYVIPARHTARQAGDPRPPHYDPRTIFLSRS